jgi:hypothetical protein
MIAKNYIKYPEALRFQCEMFSNGYKNSPRIMRLMTVLFDWKEAAPQWWKSFKALENLLIKGWKEMQLDFFTKRGEVAHPEKEESPVHQLIRNHKTTSAWSPVLTIRSWKNGQGEYLDDPVYFSYCKRAGKKPGHKRAWSWGSNHYCAYWGGFSD